MIYKYSAFTEKGTIITDTINSKNKAMAIVAIEARGWNVEKIKLNLGASFVSLMGSSIGGVKFKDRLIFTRNLAVMMKAGISLDASLEILSEQTENPRMSHVLSKMNDSIVAGKSLSEALAEFPNVFSVIYVNIVSAAEQSGTLEKSLNQLAEQLEKTNELRGRIRNALFYPAIVISATFIVSILLAIFVLPKVTRLFVSFNATLPLATRVLIKFSDIITNQPLALAVGGGVVFIFLFVFFKAKVFKPFIHYTVLHIPVIGKISKYFNVALFARTMTTLLNSGVPINNALEVTSTTMRNLTYHKALVDIYENQQSGESLGILMQQYPKLFSPLVYRMIAVGEESGNLEETLDFIANYHEQEIDVITKNLSTIVEPLLLVFIGLAVGVVALAIITPIYQITGSFQF